MARGQPITKAFGRLRQRLGIGERLEGQRQASKDLHSLRRWHASNCRDALNGGAMGFTMYTLADNLGHAKEGSRARHSLVDQRAQEGSRPSMWCNFRV